MSKNLRKFVNPRFVRTADLHLLRRLLGPHAAQLKGLDMAVFDGEAPNIIRALEGFFAGPDESYPEGLVLDLHRIAELGNRNGLRILQEQAHRQGVIIAPPGDDEVRHDPKHIALRLFLEHRGMFDAATDMLSCTSLSSYGEYAGAEEGIEPRMDGETQALFRERAEKLLEADLRGRFCRVGWYDDDGEINVVVTHGAPMKATEVIEDGADRIIRFREAEHAVLSYDPVSGRLKVGGFAKARRSELAEIFAGTMLGLPGFFGAADAQDLYTLGPIERSAFGFTFTHAFDVGIRRVHITKVQVDRIGTDARSGKTRALHSITTDDFRLCALRRLGEQAPGIAFGTDWRINHVVLRVEFDVGEARPTRVTIKLKPPSIAMFKRHQFEGRIMTLLRRNGLMVDRDPGRAALAAE